MEELNRYRGSMLGLAVGDALGTTVEFKPPGSFEPVTDIVGGGPFRLPVGAWTDDTSMALCLAESLLEKRAFDPTDQLERYVRWWREGHLSSTGHCFDIGGATSASLARFESTGEPYPGDRFTDAGGNGALMRLAPVPLAFASDPAEAIERAALSARATHGMVQSTDGCRYFAGLIVGALHGVSKEELLYGDPYHPAKEGWGEPGLHIEIREVAAGSFLRRQPPDINGSGYVVRSLEAALWALARTDNFRDGALAVVNLGHDADTTGAIYGQLAGAIHGAENIPAEWLDKLIMKEEIEAMAYELFELSRELTE